MGRKQLSDKQLQQLLDRVKRIARTLFSKGYYEAKVREIATEYFWQERNRLRGL